MSLSLPPELPVEDVAAVCCQTCGLCDASLRYSEHPTVISMLVTTGVSTRLGIWCARCRAIESTKALGISLLAGWWSARGANATADAIGANLRGGKQPASINAQMLRVVARHQLESGNFPLAASFARAAHTTQPQRENSRMLDELTKAGHAGVVPSSPWRFAPYAPLVVLAVALATLIAVKRLHRNEPAPEPVAATPTRPALTAPAKRPVPIEDVSAYANLSADELEQRLQPDSSEALAKRFIAARLRKLQADLEPTVRRGESLASLELTVKGMQQLPAVARVLETDALRRPYESLVNAINLSARYYHGGAPVEAVERTAGELLPVAQNVELASLEAEERGMTQRSDALSNEADMRAASLLLMKHDLRVRAAVITLLTRELNNVVAAAGQ